MKLTAKLMIMLLGVIMVGLAINGYIRVQREVRFFDFDMERDARALGNGLGSALAHAWSVGGQARAMQLLADANKRERLVRSRWIWMDARADDPYGPRLPRQALEPLARGESVSARLERGEYGGYRYTYVPVEVEAAKLGAVEISEPLSQINEYTRETIIRTVVTTGLMSAFRSRTTAKALRKRTCCTSSNRFSRPRA